MKVNACVAKPARRVIIPKVAHTLVLHVALVALSAIAIQVEWANLGRWGRWLLAFPLAALAAFWRLGSAPARSTTLLIMGV